MHEEILLTSGKKSTRSTILFVEDSQDVRRYVSDLLKNDYKILLAEDATAGIQMAKKNLPDLILSDIMMPGIDGIEFCHRIKSDWQTSHIPVILLTAKAAAESKLEGLESGADDYLTKPFSFEELTTRIKNLIEQRKLLREKFSMNISLNSGATTVSHVDNEFIKKVLSSVEKNLHNREFDTETLAGELFVSRRQLHRKLLAVTGSGPGEFIRIFKLKRASELLRENHLSITQIAYEVGFESPAQFTRAFKKYFGCLPSEFSKTPVAQH
jgi:DNA-binding response OmpR family regulator